MKKVKLLNYLLGFLMFWAFTLSLNSCKDDNDLEIAVDLGTITGVITDEFGEPVVDVSVILSGVDVEDMSTTSGSDGVYTISNVKLGSYVVSFSKEGWLSTSVTILTSKFSTDNVATVDVSMENASAKIVGTVTDSKNGGAALAGVTVSIGAAGTVTTGEDGTYSIESLKIQDYTVTYTYSGYATVSRDISSGDFVDGIATLDAELGGIELLRGLTASDLTTADLWYYNEYTGGRNSNGAYPHWDWSTDYLCTLDFVGFWEEQNEGTTLQIRNTDVDQTNPADLDVFDSYVYGSKLITEDNKILSLRVRTHNADEAAPAYFGVQVIDLNNAEPTAVKIGETKTYGSSDYADFDFDLSDYVNKEVVIAVGIYRQATGDYYKQLVLSAIRFASAKVEGTVWLPGTEVISGWKLTEEMVRSTMVHTKSSFTGISPLSGNRDAYVDAYQSWRDINHIAKEWAFMPIKKDPEVFPSEGYIIKTRNTPEVDLDIPESYFYGKFGITAGNNQLTFKTRNFSTENYTYFKFTVIQEDGTVTHIEPQSNTAQDASAADNGCWKMIHGDGGADNPEGFASFVYDLSQFNGENVIVALGVYNGAAETGENKLCIYNIDFN
ncbi:carboxypeptidase-like regulatory domain-containing protein [Plebeiibacterium sediminum]|uniref:Carboxypeptidase-like regulatory domain-containing protein n=1 Tax=Plebeiibacterium sediminum TaxID=2992112 RepID=A0AAE3SG50_9BACT|nr:carboxypeptidase-like regulatory domain-containing protein [Plebeiobacterium sediminum]MCW3787936.1 carboxypeptidase-like regulatory domain-containing protein [Plebeiobacterium sediminum]